MSSYTKTTKHPVTGEWMTASWIDDYFGSHRYGVKFINFLTCSPTEYKLAKAYDPKKIKLETK